MQAGGVPTRNPCPLIPLGWVVGVATLSRQVHTDSPHLVLLQYPLMHADLKTVLEEASLQQHYSLFQEQEVTNIQLQWCHPNGVPYSATVVVSL